MKPMIIKSARRATPLLVLLLAACGTPVFKQPAVQVPAAFKHAGAGPVLTAADGTRWRAGQPAEQLPRGQWWRVFGDAELTKLVEEANGANFNLAAAAARVRQARAIAGIAEADRVPQVSFGAGAERSRSAATGGAPAAHATIYHTRLSASYEVDLFGRVAANTSAARSDAATAEANFRSVLLALQADVAQTYFRLRATDAELGTLRETVRLLEETVAVDQRRFALGGIGEFDLSRSKTELARWSAEAIGLQRQRATLEHALAVLVGRPAAEFTVPASALTENDQLPAIPSGLPSELLERRPDIAAAQKTMEASNARIGVARSAMFPAISIGAQGGGAGGAVSDVLNWSSGSWVLGALLSLPLIDGGRNASRVAQSEAVLEESVATYRQSVLVAFAEVEDNLAGLRILAEQDGQLGQAVTSARRSADLAGKLYDAGRTSYLDLLDAKRNLAEVERSAVQLRGTRAVTTVALIRSLGGGWEPVSAR